MVCIGAEIFSDFNRTLSAHLHLEPQSQKTQPYFLQTHLLSELMGYLSPSHTLDNYPSGKLISPSRWL